MRLPIEPVIKAIPTKVEKGQMYFVAQGKDYMHGKGQARPGIVVSGDGTNNSDRVMVVFLTKQHGWADTLVPVKVEGDESFAICNNINTIFKDRLQRYLGTVTKEEMQAIEKAMKKALGMQAEESWKDKPLCIGCPERANYEAMAKKVEKVAEEAKIYKRMFDELMRKVVDRG